MDDTQSPPAFNALCRNLRSQEMYYLGLGQEKDPFSSGIYWCAKTQEGFGPDGQAADKIQCCAGRICYID